MKQDGRTQQAARWRGWRKLAALVGGLAVLVLTGVALVWHTCGLRSCPDVRTLRGYMPDEASVVLDRNGREVARLHLTRRAIVEFDSMSPHAVAAFVAMEDKRFWKHHGVDWWRVLAAAWKNAKAGEIAEGSSTITMQLARNVFPQVLPANERTLWRKIAEARVARDIEGVFSKTDILQMYLNHIYFGSGAHGIEAAAQEYFGKPAASLTLAEASLLASLPRAPSRLNPRSNEAEALAGRQVVLERMLEQGLIDEATAEAARSAKLRLRHGRAHLDEAAPYFVEAVRRQLEEQLGDAIFREGYTIHTTLDAQWQELAEAELRAQLRAIETGRYGRYRHPVFASARPDTAQTGSPYLQAAVIVMEVGTGDVRVMIGGRDYGDSQFNRATQAVRQPGSAFKPFVYAAALSAGYPPSHRLEDLPLRITLDDGQTWEPKNYDDAYEGEVSLRDALVFSRNVPTVRLAMELGIGRVVEAAQRIGLSGRIPAVPAVALGAAEVTPLDLTAAYATFAALGEQARPRLVTRVVDRRGRTVLENRPVTRSALDPAVAYVMTSLLKDVIERGTGTAVRAAGFTGVAAGKTGTTNDAADVWFVGFTPALVGTIWMGFDERKTVLRGATGGELAAPLWGRIMKGAQVSTADWVVPAGVEARTVDAQGNMVRAGCAAAGSTHIEYFMTGTAPLDHCVYTGDDIARYDVAADSAGTRAVSRRDGSVSDAAARGARAAHESVRAHPPSTVPDSLPRRPPPRLLGRPLTPEPPTRDTLFRPPARH